MYTRLDSRKAFAGRSTELNNNNIPTWLCMIYIYTTFIVYTTKTEADYRFTSTLCERPKILTLYALGMRDIHTRRIKYVII